MAHGNIVWKHLTCEDADLVTLARRAGAVHRFLAVARSLLRDALVRVNQLLLAAKQQKKQSHLLRTTLATLKQLQNVQA